MSCDEPGALCTKDGCGIIEKPVKEEDTIRHEVEGESENVLLSGLKAALKLLQAFGVPSIGVTGESYEALKGYEVKATLRGLEDTQVITFELVEAR